MLNLFHCAEYQFISLPLGDKKNHIKPKLIKYCQHDRCCLEPAIVHVLELQTGGDWWRPLDLFLNKRKVSLQRYVGVQFTELMCPTSHSVAFKMLQMRWAQSHRCLVKGFNNGADRCSLRRTHRCGLLLSAVIFVCWVENSSLSLSHIQPYALRHALERKPSGKVGTDDDHVVLQVHVCLTPGRVRPMMCTSGWVMWSNRALRSWNQTAMKH